MFSHRFVKCICTYQKCVPKRCLHTSYRISFAWTLIEKSTKIQMNKKDLYGNNSNTKLEYLSSLNIDTENHASRLSSIICTIGPASADVDKLEAMIEAGMNIARLNFSHGTHDYHLNTVNNIRKAVENYSKKIKVDYPLAIALDTKGPEIRTGEIAGESDASKEVMLKKGELIRLTTNKKFEKTGSNKQVYVDCVKITDIVKKGNSIHIDDGLLLLTATKVGKDYIDCKIENGGLLGSRKGVNLPGLNVDLPAVSEKDMADLKFAVDHNLDFIFASFIREASAVHEIRKILGQQGEHILIVSKIENHQGMKNLQSIIDASDGIMVARGDLGIEIPPEKVFLAQKSILAQCNMSGTPGICATQMLESMITKPRATRAEYSDVANAIMDGADCVMLSGETAKGKYPVECIRAMDKLCHEAETAIWRKEFFNDLVSTVPIPLDKTQAIAVAAVDVANKISAAAIIVYTRTGRSAHMIAKYRPRNVIIAVTNDERIARQCHLRRGIIPVFCPETEDETNAQIADYCMKYAINFGKHVGILSSGDILVFVKGPNKEPGFTDTIYVASVPSAVETC